MITLADTSIWIEHFRRGNDDFKRLLNEGMVLIHPFVVGELACGNLGNRSAVLKHIRSLDSAKCATNDEAMELIERRGLWGRGLGWVDAHLLASALLSGCAFWSLDKRLSAAASELGVA